MSQLPSKRKPSAVESVPQATDATSGSKETDEVLLIIGQMLRGLQFGQIQVIVRDGVVVQLDRTERRRIRGSK